MGALSLLEAANMVNYFGRRHGADDVRLEPLLFRKGSVRMALYGLGNMRDERLNSLFRDGKVIFMDPGGDEAWVKVLLIHQNRVVRGAGRKNSIDERHLPANLVSTAAC
jgi:double-strand break repair protein MRE11